MDVVLPVLGFIIGCLWGSWLGGTDFTQRHPFWSFLILLAGIAVLVLTLGVLYATLT